MQDNLTWITGELKMISQTIKIYRLLSNMGAKGIYCCFLIVLNEVVGMIPTLGLGIIYMNILNAIFYNDSKLLIIAIIEFLGGTLVFCVLSPLLELALEKSVQTTAKEIRLNLYRSVINSLRDDSAVANHGDYINRITNDVNTSLEFFESWLPILFSGLFYAVGSVLLMVFIDFRVAIVAVINSSIVYFINRKKGDTIKRYNEIKRTAYGEVTESFFQLIKNFLFEKLFDRKEVLKAKLSKADKSYVETYIESSNAAASVVRNNAIVSEILGYTIYIVGALLILLNQITVGSLVALAQYQNGVTAFLNQTSYLLIKLQEIEISSARLHEAFLGSHRLTEEKMCEKTHYDSSKQTVALNIDNLCFMYEQNRPVFENLCFTAKKGEITLLKAPSGSGKTTLFNIILGILPITEGEVAIKGEKLTEANAKHLRESIGYMSQDKFIFEATVFDNIKFGNMLAEYDDVLLAARMANIHERITALPFDYKTVLRSSNIWLSGGERQRISLARTFLRRADLLLLDEPTSALDLQSAERIKHEILKLKKDTAIVIAAHDGVFDAYADAIYTIQKRKIVCVSQAKQAEGSDPD